MTLTDIHKYKHQLSTSMPFRLTLLTAPAHFSYAFSLSLSLSRMPPPSKAYLIESALYGEPPTPPERCPANVSGPPTFPDPGDDIPSDYIPGLYSLGATYNVLNGRYADSRSLLHHVVDWYKSTRIVLTFWICHEELTRMTQLNLAARYSEEDNTQSPL